ncbi:hypothetical protein ACFTS5_06055 [Nocardia sp. NPDC056952]|uniref:hypothetical protein n=1 Tax=Nocardia sp. NPDC056952 TaxID=3345979 RepID=UPI0036382174
MVLWSTRTVLNIGTGAHDHRPITKSEAVETVVALCWNGLTMSDHGIGPAP